MRYSSQPDKYPGTVDFPQYPSMGIDGEGKTIPCCEMVDTETGECFAALYERDGRPKLNWIKGIRETKRIVLPSPITILPGKGLGDDIVKSDHEVAAQ